MVKARSGPWIKIQRLRGEVSGSTGVKPTGEVTGARRRYGYRTMQRGSGCGDAHHGIAETRRGRWWHLGVEASPEVIGMARRSRVRGSGSSERSEATPAGHARKRARGQETQHDAGMRTVQAREAGAHRRTRNRRRNTAATEDSGEAMRWPGGELRWGSRGEMERRARAL